MLPPAPRTQSSATWKLRFADPVDVEERDREDLRDVAVHGAGIFPIAPISPQPARGISPSRSARISAPCSASRNMPDGPMNLSAFHSIGLWLAVTASPPAAPSSSTVSWTLGVGTMPTSTTSQPTD
jgi:hypothetical protein